MILLEREDHTFAKLRKANYHYVQVHNCSLKTLIGVKETRKKPERKSQINWLKN